MEPKVRVCSPSHSLMGLKVELKVLDIEVEFCLTELNISKIFAPAARGRLKAGGAKLPRFAYVA